MLHLRMVVPSDLVPRVLETLERAPEVTNVWHLAGAASKPPGDLVSCDVAKEEGSTVLRALRDLGIDRRGSIAVEAVDASISLAAIEAERAAPGAPADAVVWEEVEGRVSESATLSVSFLILIVAAMMIASIGIITDSIVLIIGAMVVGPEYGPLAGICVALIEGRPRLAAKSFRALAVGFPLGVIAAGILTVVLRGAGIGPDTLLPSQHELTLFISRPNSLAVIVAVLAGVVGMLALVGAKSGALIGVLISVTTIPAAANIGVAAAYRIWDDAAGAALHLGINVVAILGSGVAVLWIAGRARRRRRARQRAGTIPAGPAAAIAGMLLGVLLLGSCVGPSRSDADFRRKAANSAEAMVSVVETALLTAELAAEGSAPGPYVSLAISQAERDADSIIRSFRSVQPPSADSGRLRARVLDRLDAVLTALEELRIAAYRHQHDRLPELAAGLRDARDSLARIAEIAPV